MPSNEAEAQAEAAMDALHAILDAVEAVALAMLGVPPEAATP